MKDDPVIVNAFNDGLVHYFYTFAGFRFVLKFNYVLVINQKPVHQLVLVPQKQGY